jgi:gas vesicle protein
MFQTAVRSRLNSLQNISSDDLLGALGLQRRRTFNDDLVPTLAIFAAGAFVGATAALLLAPKPGPQLRRELSEGAREYYNRIGQTASQLGASVSNTASQLGSTVSNTVNDVREALPFGDNDKQRLEPNSNHTTVRRA